MEKHLENNSFLKTIDFSLTICSAKKDNNGEDSFACLMDDRLALACVCDGCGGAGAKKYTAFKGKSGAYIASRIVTGTIRDCLNDGLFLSNEDFVTSSLKKSINNNLLLAKKESGVQRGLKGELIKEFPTTLAAVLAKNSEKGNVQIQCLWAGDSRCYLLCNNGLKQLTNDDLVIQDALANLTADGVMTNCISLSKDYQIHSRTFEVEKPCVVFAATDGCFGYFSTPMEFEYSIIHCLQYANSIRDWEERLKNKLSLAAGDDLTMIGFAFGYGSLRQLQTSFSKRGDDLYASYVRDLEKKTEQEKQLLWGKYKEEYSQYLKN